MRYLFSMIVLLTPVATAAQDSDPQEEEARALFDAGRLAYNQGRYEAALDSFQRAYDLTPHDELLYNIGATAERLRDDERAIEAFERYLHIYPDSPHRAQVERRLEILRSATAPPEPPERTTLILEPLYPPTTDVTPPSPEPRAALPGWLLVGSGIALTVAGAVLLGIGLSDRSTVQDAPDGAMWADIEAQHSRSELFPALGITLGGAGLVAALIGTLYLLDGGTE